MCYKQEKKNKNKKYFSQVETSKAKNKLTQRVETKKKTLARNYMDRRTD